MMDIAWCCLVEVPYCFSRSFIKYQGQRALKIIEFDPNWLFPDCNSNLNTPMATKWCTKLEVAQKRCPIVFQGHTSNYKVTQCKKSSILTQISIIFKVICQIARSHGSKNRWLWPKLGISGLYLQCEIINGYEMMHKAWCSIEDVPYYFSGSSVKFQGHTGEKLTFESNLSKITRPVAAIKSLRFALFVHILRYQFETSYIHLVGSATHRVRVSPHTAHSDLLYSQIWVKVFFFSFMASTIKTSLQIWYTHLHSKYLQLYWFWSWLGNFWLGSMVATNTQIGDISRAPHQPKVFWVFFYVFWDMNFKSDIHIQQVAWHITFEFHHNQISASGEFSRLFSKCFEVSIWKSVDTLSRLHNILISWFTRMGSLWPTSCS